MKINLKSPWAPLLTLTVLGAMMLSSCGDPESPPIEDAGPDRTTPDNLISRLATSYKEQDIEAYAECLDDDFLFTFTEDIADELGLPPTEPWWGKTEDVHSANTLFESENVTDIAFSFEFFSEWEPFVDMRIEDPESEHADTTWYSGLSCRLDPIIEVTTIVEGDDPILKLRVDNSWLDVWVIPDPKDEDLWTILKIQEVKKQLKGGLGSASAATEASTWGQIKAMWQ